ncbi:Inner membrane protein YrbG, predicted calcium/sodium:proton antiporter [hydrothermal vent metagenome]|uniref:Inner membrane protein YrbG, predicted calcium/sodium:proton antiporter n=1 Tax=hydrothermal vent metagenome TaxID=652676 RepID=A0A3B1A7J0_9ZZZZ
MLLSSAAILLGLVVLVWSADRFVLGASAVARNYGISPLIIGMTILGFGTSAPEMLVSGMAAWEGNPTIGVGNALGSNIANIALVLGFTAIVSPMVVRSKVLKREFPLLFLVMGLAAVLMIDNDLSRVDGFILLSGVVVMLWWMIRLARQEQAVGEEPLEAEFDDEIPTDMSTGRAFFWLLLGLVLLMVSSWLLVWGAVNVAHYFGVSDLIIGLTIIAIGTSLPELAATVSAALKKEHEMAIGNIIGSNLFNILAVLALPGIIMPTVLGPEVMSRDFVVMTLLTVALFLMAYGFKGKDGQISRIEGAVLLASFVGYMVMLYFAVVG